MEPNLFCIIPTHNEKEQVLRLIAQLFADPFPKKVVVVDNGSTDGTIATVRHLEQAIYVIENHANIGFVKALNVGVSFALANRATHLLLFDPSVQIESLAVTKLLARKTDITGAVMHWQEQSRYSAGMSLFRLIALPRIIFLPQKPPNSFNSTPHAISFDACFIKRRVFEKIGLVDEQFTSYFAEIAFCEKAKKQGVKLSIDPSFVVAVASKKQLKSLQARNAYWQDFSHFSSESNGFFYKTTALLRPLLRFFFHPAFLR